MKRNLLLILLMVYSYIGYSQGSTKVNLPTNQTTQNENSEQDFHQFPSNIKTVALDDYSDIENAYQVICSTDVSPVITPQILQQIRALQDNTEIKYLELNDVSKVKIFPRALVQSDVFRPVNKYHYEN